MVAQAHIHVAAASASKSVFFIMLVIVIWHAKIRISFHFRPSRPYFFPFPKLFSDVPRLALPLPCSFPFLMFQWP
jgi:hypothetical protein